MSCKWEMSSTVTNKDEHDAIFWLMTLLQDFFDLQNHEDPDKRQLLEKQLKNFEVKAKHCVPVLHRIGELIDKSHNEIHRLQATVKIMQMATGVKLEAFEVKGLGEVMDELESLKRREEGDLH